MSVAARALLEMLSLACGAAIVAGAVGVGFSIYDLIVFNRNRRYRKGDDR